MTKLHIIFDTTKYLGEKDWIFIIFPNLTIYS